MADDLNTQIDAEYDKRALAAQVDAEYDKRYGGGPEHGSLLSGTLASAAHSVTLHGDNYFTSPEWQAKNKNFQKNHPVLSGVGEAAGIVGGMVASTFLPGAQATLPARGAVAAGRLAKLADYLLPYGNFMRSATPSAGWKEAAKEGAKGSVKLGVVSRFNDPIAPGQQTPIGPLSYDPDKRTDPLERLAGKFAQRSGKAVDFSSMAWDAGGGAVMAPLGNAVGGYVGNRLANLGQAATLGGLPKRGAVLDIKHEIGRDSTGGGVDGALDRIRNLVYGENRTLGQHGAGPQRGAIPQEAERELASHFYRLTQRGYTDAEAERLVGAALARRAASAERNMSAGIPSEHGWLLYNNGTTAAPGTMGGWAKTAGNAYRNRNAVPSNLTELTALANGGEAPALQSTLKKLLNLKSDGPERSTFLRGLRDRQKGIKGQMEAVGRRFLGNGDVGEAVAEHLANAQNANALYPGIYANLSKVPDAAQRLSAALRPVIEGTQNTIGKETDAVSRKVLGSAESFLNPIEVQGAGAEVPLLKRVTENVKDESGKIVGATQREVPMTRITSYGDEISSKTNPGGKITEWEPSGDLESILRRRAALGDEIKMSKRAGSDTLTQQLSEFKANIDKALHGLGNQSDDFGKAMAQWSAANDTRATAGQLERTYKEALGLNLNAKKGDSLVDLARFHTKFQRLDPANQDMARRGIMGQFKAMLETGGDLHDAAKIFSNARTRKMLTEMIGPEATEEFGGFVARAGLATNTFNMNKGSQTASILDADKEGGWLSNIAGAIWHGNPLRAVAHMGEMAGDAMKRKKHADMTGLLSADTTNPARLEEVLANIRRAAAPVNQRLQTMATGSRTAGTGIGAELGKRRDE